VAAGLLLLAVLLTLAATAGAVASRWRRLGARRFDAVYERNLLRRTGRG
jgi:hypothetical protein